MAGRRRPRSAIRATHRSVMFGRSPAAAFPLERSFGPLTKKKKILDRQRRPLRAKRRSVRYPGEAFLPARTASRVADGTGQAPFLLYFRSRGAAVGKLSRATDRAGASARKGTRPSSDHHGPVRTVARASTRLQIQSILKALPIAAEMRRADVHPAISHPQ